MVSQLSSNVQAVQRVQDNGYQQNVQNTQPGYTAAQQQPYLCFECGAPGHIARFCPRRQNAALQQPIEHQPSRLRAAYQPQSGYKQNRAHGSGHYLGSQFQAAKSTEQKSDDENDDFASKNVYLPMKIAGKNIAALLDSGCEITIMPARLVRKHQVQVTSKTLVAANGTEIPIVGWTTVKATVGRPTVTISG